MNKIKNYILILFLILVSMSCSKKEVPKEVIRPVRYVKALSQKDARIRSFSGVAKAGVESKLSFKVKGTVKELLVDVGESVKKSEVIAILDDQDYLLQVQQLEASLRQTEAKLRQTQANYDRVRALYENNNASRNDLDSARAASESSKASVDAIVKKLELANLQVSYTKLIAPLQGSIASVNIEINENIQAGQPVVVLTSGSTLEIDVSIPEMLISDVNVSDAVKVVFSALPDKTFLGYVSEVGIAATQYVTTYPVTIKLQEGSSQIRSGMAAEVSFNFAKQNEEDIFIVPGSAVQEDIKGRYVYAVKPLSKDGLGVICRKNVEIRDLTSEGIEILKGITDGDCIVISGVSQIRDGQKVKFEDQYEFNKASN